MQEKYVLPLQKSLWSGRMKRREKPQGFWGEKREKGNISREISGNILFFRRRWEI